MISGHAGLSRQRQPRVQPQQVRASRYARGLREIRGHLHDLDGVSPCVIYGVTESDLLTFEAIERANHGLVFTLQTFQSFNHDLSHSCFNRQFLLYLVRRRHCVWFTGISTEPEGRKTSSPSDSQPSGLFHSTGLSCARGRSSRMVRNRPDRPLALSKFNPGWYG